MDSIRIQGYKSIKDATIELKPINILIGGNGSGKSNFLSFFEFLNAMVERRLQVYVALKGIEKFLHKGRQVTTIIQTNLGFHNVNMPGFGNYYDFELTAGESHFVFTGEYGRFQSYRPTDLVNHNIASRGTEAAIPALKTGYKSDEAIRKYFAEIKKYHFHDTGRNSPFNRTNNIQNDSYYLYEDGGNMAAMLYAMKEKNAKDYELILNIIQSIAPYFLDFYFEPNENNLMHLQWRDKYSSILYGATDLSDGTIRFIALCILFMQPKLPATIVIDEPELGLHPQAIGMLAGMMQSAAARGSQIIAATQSVELIDEFKPEDVLVVDMKNGESIYTRLDAENLSNWLDNYTLGDLWKRNVIGKGQP